MKVSDIFNEDNIDLDFITANFNGDYWDSAYKFVAENWDQEADDITEKQMLWLIKIKHDCVNERDKEALR